MIEVGKKYFAQDTLECIPKLHGFQGGYREGLKVNPRPGVVAYPPGATVALQDDAGW